MWLTSSSIGRKFVMAVTGACLVLFVTFHVAMNAVCILWPTAYNQVCMFLGANWYALVASMGLAALFIIHIIYAVWLTVQNRNARGDDRYAVTSRPPQVEWSSKNMLVLGLVIVAFLLVHLFQFWAKMQLMELMGSTAHIDGAVAPPEYGTLFIQAAFSQLWVPVVYIIGFVALWFHMNHGFWSMFHTVGWDNNIWIKRLKVISLWWTSIVVGLFIVQTVVFTVQAQQRYYLEDEALQNQYSEYFGHKAIAVIDAFKAEQIALDGLDQQQAQTKFIESLTNTGEKLKDIVDQADKLCPKGTCNDLDQARNLLQQIQQTMGMVMMQAQGMGQEPMPEDDVVVEESEVSETTEAAPAPQAAPAPAPAPEAAPAPAPAPEAAPAPEKK